MADLQEGTALVAKVFRKSLKGVLRFYRRSRRRESGLGLSWVKNAPAALKVDFRFTPEIRHRLPKRALPLCAAIHTPIGKRFETLSTTRGADLSPRPLRLLRQPRLILKATRLDPHLRAFFRAIPRILFGRSLWLCDANCGQCASHLLHLDNQRSKCRIR
jgi:hypothetical protein